MKHNYKLVFNDYLDAIKFAVNLFNYVISRKDWFKAYDCIRRKNILYVYTANYNSIDNFINNKQYNYNYTIIKL